MKKWIKRINAAFFGGMLCLSSLTPMQVYAAEQDMRAVWISTVYSADYPSVTNDIEGQKREFTQKLDRMGSWG